MSDYNINKNADLSKKEPDKYSGMRELHLGLGPNVLLCALGGGILGAILSLWATTDVGVLFALGYGLSYLLARALQLAAWGRGYSLGSALARALPAALWSRWIRLFVWR